MWARWREAATGFTPEKEGLPRRTILSTAAVVSFRRWATSSGSVSGRRRRARSLPSSVTAWSASSSSTRGSSKVSMDFSNRSVMGSLLCLNRKFRARWAGLEKLGHGSYRGRRL